MLKKLLVSLLSALLCISVVAETESQLNGIQNETDVKIDENGFVFVSPLKYHITSDSTAEVIKDYSYGKLESVVIPSEIQVDDHVYSVTSIGDRAFSYCSGLTSIEIPSSVTSIGISAFSGCSGLTSINVATDNAIYSSENGVLYDKNRTKLICVPGGKKGKFVVPSGVTSIGDYAFKDCSGLTSIEIPSSVTSIGNSAFSWCAGLTSIEIPSSVTSIEDGAFSGCSGLTSINVATDNQIYTSENGVLYDKKKTKLICVPGAKKGKFEIPSSVTSIESWAFSECGGLSRVKIPSSVTSIGVCAFTGCSGLTSIKIPSSVTNIGDYAFDRCSGLTSIKIPSGVTSIDNYSFPNCGGLKSIKIPSSVTYIGNGEFADCGNLKNIEVESGNSVYSSENGILYDKNKTKLICVPRGKTGKLVIPSGVASIGDNAFMWCRRLKNIEIPSSVTSIGDRTFWKCWSLMHIEIPSGVTSIGYEAFSECGELKNIEIPSGVTSIGDGAFSGCDGLTHIEIPSSVTSIGDNAFMWCKNLEIVIDNSKENVKVGSDAFMGCKSVKYLK